MRALFFAPLGLALLAAACGETTGQRATTGAAGGAVTGAAVGGPVGAVVGGGIGAAGGAYRPEVDQKTDQVTQNTVGRNDTVQRNDTMGATGTQTRRGAAASTGGASRDQVRQAQTALQKLGYYNGKVDGLNGPQTRAAVRSYQAKANLNQSGRLDRNTMQHLRADAGSGSTSTTAPRSTTSGSSGVNAPDNASSPTSAGDPQLNR